MKRMKTFLIYLLLVVAAILLTNPLADLILNTNYRDINKYEITTTSPEIRIEESKATKVNGRIKGKVKNSTEKFMQDVYIKIELKSNLGNILGTEYVKLGNFQPNQEKDFSLNYRYSGVDNYIVSATNEIEPSNVKLDPILEHAESFYKIGRLIVSAISPNFFFFPLFLFTTTK